MSNTVLGQCSICGGRVSVPSVWWGITPPTPTCESCGAIRSDNGPVIPMVPAPRINTTRTVFVDDTSSTSAGSVALRDLTPRDTGKAWCDPAFMVRSPFVRLPATMALLIFALFATGCAGITTSAEYDAERGIWRFSVRGSDTPVVGVAVPQGSTPVQAVAAFAVRQSGGSAEAGRQTCVRAARLIAAAGAAAGASAGADALVSRVLANAAAAEAEAK